MKETFNAVGVHLANATKYLSMAPGNDPFHNAAVWAVNLGTLALIAVVLFVSIRKIGAGDSRGVVSAVCLAVMVLVFVIFHGQLVNLVQNGITNATS